MDNSYSLLIAELGKLIQIPLTVDSTNTCSINFPKDKLEIQIEQDMANDTLIIAATIIKLPPGRFRQNIFEQALKANNLDTPRGGILAYVPRSDELVIFQRFTMKDLKADRLAGEMVPFKEKLKKWRDSIENNEIPLLMNAVIKSPSSGMFGLT